MSSRERRSDHWADLHAGDRHAAEGMKRRDWEWARMKVNAEARCRVCKTPGYHEAAHIIGRKYDPADGVVQPDDIVPLCRECHTKYDAHALSLLPYLTLEEQAAAVRHVGIVRALRRVDAGTA